MEVLILLLSASEDGPPNLWDLRKSEARSYPAIRGAGVQEVGA
jgi:hypothetical protein